MKTGLNLPKLADRYELKARLAPALLSCSTAIPGIAVLSSDALGWVLGFSVAGGGGALLAIGLMYLASAAGRRYERSLWPRWPHDAPTNQRLQPSNASHSREQRKLWYVAIKKLTSLDIAGAVERGDQNNLELTINDAVTALRHRFRSAKHSGLLQTHNEDYGFARNLTGLRLFWFPSSVASLAIAWWAVLVNGSEIIWAILASIASAMCTLLLFVLPTYVRQRAERYAESFFGTLGYQSSEEE